MAGEQGPLDDAGPAAMNGCRRRPQSSKAEPRSGPTTSIHPKSGSNTPRSFSSPFANPGDVFRPNGLVRLLPCACPGRLRSTLLQRAGPVKATATSRSPLGRRVTSGKRLNSRRSRLTRPTMTGSTQRMRSSRVSPYWLHLRASRSRSTTCTCAGGPTTSSVALVHCALCSVGYHSSQASVLLPPYWACSACRFIGRMCSRRRFPRRMKRFR
jgi:hypothetical protein